MATNAPTEEQEILVRDSTEHKDYLRYQFGRITEWVNAFETRIAIAGRAMLLVYVIYITVKAGAGAALPQNIPWLNVLLLVLDIFMLALQVLGLEGAVPGLIHLADDLESKGKTKEANSVRRAAGTAQFLVAATAIDVVLQYSPHVFTLSGNQIDISGLAFGYDKILFIVRLVIIGQYLKAMARLKHKGPKVISQHEHEKQQKDKEQEQIRLDNAAIQQSINQALATWRTAQDQHLSGWSTGLLNRLQEQQQNVLASMPQPQNVDIQAVIQAVAAQFETRFQDAMRQLDAQMRQQTLVSQVSETSRRETRNLVSGNKQPVSRSIVSLPAPRALRQRKSSQDVDVETTIIALLDKDKSHTVRALAQLAGTSTATAGRIRKEYFETINQSVSADEVEDNETKSVS